MSGRKPSAYNLFVKEQFAAAGGKTTLSAVAAAWRASGQASTAPKRGPSTNCKGVPQADCNPPCGWRTYGPKSKKSAYCYRTRAPSATRTASLMARGVAAAQQALYA